MKTRDPGRSGHTLIEVLVALAIFLVAMSIVLTAFVAVLRRAHHTDSLLKGAAELRQATDVVSRLVRTAPQTPTVSSSGLELTIAPLDLGFATVLATTWIDTVRNVKGSKSNQRMLHLSNVAGSATGNSIFVGTARPSGTLTAADVGTYFISSDDLPTIDLNAVFASGDTITIPATAYGAQTTGVINNISNNSGNKTLTFTADLGVDVPNGTKIPATAGRRHLIRVETNGELRHYPDHRNLAAFVVLARDIDPSPLSDPADPTSAVTVPFTITSRTVLLNLQKVPRGSTAGRTVQGIMTNVQARTDPLIP